MTRARSLYSELSTPHPVRGGTVVASRAGHLLAVDSAGIGHAWGAGGYGQLGSGTFGDLSEPSYVAGLPQVVSVSAGWRHSLALELSGSVWAWGSDWHGELGVGEHGEQCLPTPQRVVKVTSATAIACGQDHSMALLADGTTWTWGDNTFGQLGQRPETMSNTLVPVPVGSVTGVIAIAAGGFHSLALRSDLSVWAWGMPRPIVAAAPGAADYVKPSRVPNLPDVVGIAGGWRHSLAIDADGGVWAWGSNSHGELGASPTLLHMSDTPIRVAGLPPLLEVTCGLRHCVGLASDGSVWGWGSNEYGQLGAGVATDGSEALRIDGLDEIVAIAAGGTATFGVRTDGSVIVVGSTWGERPAAPKRLTFGRGISGSRAPLIRTTTRPSADGSPASARLTVHTGEQITPHLVTLARRSREHGTAWRASDLAAVLQKVESVRAGVVFCWDRGSGEKRATVWQGPRVGAVLFADAALAVVFAGLDEKVRDLIDGVEKLVMVPLVDEHSPVLLDPSPELAPYWRALIARGWQLDGGHVSLTAKSLVDGAQAAFVRPLELPIIDRRCAVCTTLAYARLQFERSHDEGMSISAARRRVLGDGVDFSYGSAQRHIRHRERKEPPEFVIAVPRADSDVATELFDKWLAERGLERAALHHTDVRISTAVCGGGAQRSTIIQIRRRVLRLAGDSR